MFRELVRKNKQLPMEECISLLKSEKRGVLSVIGDNDYPYGMPMNHFYNDADGCVYFHCGNVGHRLEALQKNQKVSFCCYDSGTPSENHWALTVNSVIVFGEAEIIDDMQQIIDITTQLSYKFIQDDEYIKGEIAASGHRTLLVKLTPQHICGKKILEA